MKPPPLLLGAALLFWGWQSGLFLAGALLAVLAESARFITARWEFSDEDFSRVWTFCWVLFLAAAVYAFTSNEGPSSFGNFFADPNAATQRGAGTAGAHTAAAVFRWLPMIFFPFLALQLFNTREFIPLAAISLILRRRAKHARSAGRPAPAPHNVNVAYPYFALTLLAAGVHAADDNSFFWGLCAFVTWALWTQRSRRFAFALWLGALALAITLGFCGQRGVGQLQRYLENVNPQWLTRFLRRGYGFDAERTRTALGNVGELKMSGQIVIRLKPRAGEAVPTYLREASYRSYKSPIWFAGGSKDDFSSVVEETPLSGNWNLLGAPPTTAAVNIACYLDGMKNGTPAGLLPLPTGSRRLEQLPVFVLEKNPVGAVLAQGPRFLMFDAWYGPGATIDLPPGANEGLNNVPANEVAALDQVIREFQLRGETPAETLRRVGGFFARHFTYRTWQDEGRARQTNNTPLNRFLLQTRSGHCEYFATATVLLLRRLNIPARYAVGYSVHEAAGSGYVVRLRDAHAWCLVWDAQAKIWRDFDTTPGSWIKAEEKRKSPFQWLADAWSWIGFELSRLKLLWAQGRLRQYVLWIMVPLLGWLLYKIVFRRGRQRKPKPASAAGDLAIWPGLDSEFYQLETKLAERGVPRGASEPWNEWLARVAATPGLAELREPLRPLLRLHYRYRFDPDGLSAADRAVLKQEVRECLEKLSQAAIQPDVTA